MPEGNIRILWGEGSFLALIGNSYSDGVMRKMPYAVDAVDVLHRPASHPIFIGLVKT